MSTLKELGFGKIESPEGEILPKDFKQSFEQWVRKNKKGYEELLEFNLEKETYSYSGFYWGAGESVEVEVSIPLHLAIQERMIELKWGEWEEKE